MQFFRHACHYTILVRISNHLQKATCPSVEAVREVRVVIAA